MDNARELHIDRALTTFSQMYGQGLFIADQVLPFVKVKNLSDKYKVYGTEHLKRIKTALAENGMPNLFESKFGTDGTYSLKGYGLHRYVSKAAIDNADKPITPMKTATEQMVDALLMEAEMEAATLITTAASYASANKITFAAGDKWSNYSGSTDPSDQVRVGATAVRNACGRPPNSIVMDWQVAETLSHHPAVVDLVKYTHKDQLTGTGLPPYLWGLKVIAAGGMYDSALRGATMSLSNIWGKYCCIAYIHPKPGLETITLGVTFKKGDRKVLKSFDEKVGVDGSWFLKAVLPRTDKKLIAATCGYLITNAIA